MPERMTNQVMVRMDDQLTDALRADAEANGRTVAQSIRFYLRVALISTPAQEQEG
jgi:hypothetical protein